MNSDISSTDGVNWYSLNTGAYSFVPVNFKYANQNPWGQSYGFDGFGNLLSKTVTAGSGPSLSIAVNPANNRIQGVGGISYDANGNQNVGNYDAENRLILAGGLQYAYDAQNRRNWIWNGAFDSYGQGNPSGYQIVAYSPSGQKLGTYQFNVYAVGSGNQIGYNVTTTLTSSDQYFGGRRLAVMDQLGSARSSR